MDQKRAISRRRFLPAGIVAAGAASSAAGSANLFGQAPAVRPASRYPVFAAVDVLVAGGGPAGIGAALAAARAGAKTLLVENHSFFGGVAAWALGMPINQVRPGGKLRSAIHELLIRKLAAYGDQAVEMGKHELWCTTWSTCV
jgi:NADPH-dependent 2,4-dienoyl-CoA reductase/sulfur reductase-like enzyme